MPDLELLLFGLRLAAVAALYIFILLIVAAALRDLRSTSRVEAQAKPDGLMMLDPGGSGTPSGTVLPLVEKTTVGRLPQSTIYLPDESVSGRHAVLQRNGRRWLVEDLGSTNGTFLNGEPVNREMEVRDGDIVTFGRVRLRLERGG